MPTKRDLGRSDHRVGSPLDERLGTFHRVGVIGVRLVPLQLCELRRVLVRHALVAEVLRDLVHLLQSAHDQALEVELVRDAQIDVSVEVVRVGDERLRKRAAVLRLKDGRLDLDEPFPVEVGPDLGDHPRPHQRIGARALVHQQVEIPLPVALLRVGQAVERIRQRAPDLSEQDELVDRNRRLAAARLRRRPGHADDVTQIDVDGPGPRCVAEELDPTTAVDEIDEDELSQLAPRQRTAGDAYMVA